LRRQNSASDAFQVVGMAATSSPGVENYVSGLNPNGNGVLLISATSGFGNCGTITQIAKPPDQANQPHYLARSNGIFNDTESDSYFSFKNVKTNFGSVTDAFNSVNPPMSASVTRPASLPGAQISAEKSSSSNESAQPSLLARAASSLLAFAHRVDSVITPSAHAATRLAVSDQRSENRDQRSDIRSNHARSVRSGNAATRTTTNTAMPVVCATTVTHICVDIGTLHPGDSVQISFSVTVNNPPNLSLLNP